MQLATPPWFESMLSTELPHWKGNETAFVKFTPVYQPLSFSTIALSVESFFPCNLLRKPNSGRRYAR